MRPTEKREGQTVRPLRVLGITGGVGCGKSTVLSYLQSVYGAFVIQCDEVARQLQEPGGICYAPMVSLLGETILLPDGAIDRGRAAKIVFADEKVREQLNAIVHPAVKARVRELIDAYAASCLVVVEAALLLEDHYDALCDEIWYVHTDDAVRRERLSRDRGYSNERIDAMFESQRSAESFREATSCTIDNSDSDVRNLYRQLDLELGKRGIEKLHALG